MIHEIAVDGFEIVHDVVTDAEISTIIKLVSNADTSNPIFRKSKDLFAIRQFFKHMPQVAGIVMGSKIGDVLKERFGADYFVVKSIYFDKPSASNWFVSYHQDLTISVKDKIDIKGFGPWTVKEGQFAVQPPLDLL
jgi:hypothetical protein